MSAPNTWQAPSAGSEVTITRLEDRFGRVTFADGYWFASGIDTIGQVTLRYATNPKSTWTEVTVPSPPGYSTAIPIAGCVQSDGTNYALLVAYWDGVTVAYYIIHTTDPTGSWSYFDFNPSNGKNWKDLKYVNGTWVAVGYVRSLSFPVNGAISYCSTLTGTWTHNASAATNGYTPTYVIDINGIDHDGVNWVTVAYDSYTDDYHTRYSTSINSGWTDPGGTQPRLEFRFNNHGNGWWSCSDAYGDVHYTDDPASGAWTTIGPATHGCDASVGGITYSDGYWLISGGRYVSGNQLPRVVYLETTGAPSGTWTAANSLNMPNSHHEAVDVYGNARLFVTMSTYKAQLRYTSVAPPTYLRLHQSPVYAPSRVRPVQLRQRQRPEVTT